MQLQSDPLFEQSGHLDKPSFTKVSLKVATKTKTNFSTKTKTKTRFLAKILIYGLIFDWLKESRDYHMT